MFEVIAIIAKDSGYSAHCDGVCMKGNSPKEALENLINYWKSREMEKNSKKETLT